MARVALPESRLKARRRRRRLVVLAGWVVLALVAGGTVIGLAYLPHWRLVAVEVEGVEGAQARGVEQVVQGHLTGRYFLIFPKNNLALYPRALIEADLLQEFPIFGRAEVRAKNLRTLQVTVAERTPKALWCGAARVAPTPCLLLDETGVAYEAAAEFAGPVYTTYYGALATGALPRQYLQAEMFRSLAALAAALEEHQNKRVVSVETDKAGDARLRFAGGFELIISLQDAGGDIYERFTLALTAEPFNGRSINDFEYLDLRFGDRLYYKRKGE